MTTEATFSSRSVTYHPPPDPASLPKALLEKCAKLDLQLPAASAQPVDQLIDYLLQQGGNSDLLGRWLPRIQHPLSARVTKEAHNYGTRWGRSTNEQLLVPHGLRVIAAVDRKPHCFIHEFESLATAVTGNPTKLRQNAARTKPDAAGRNLAFPPPEVMNKGIQDLKVWLRLHQASSAVLQAAVACQVLLSCHPLPDGNGRTARTLANALLIYRGKMPESMYIPLNEMFILALGGMDLRSRIVDLYGRWVPWLGWFCDVVEASLALSSAHTAREQTATDHAPR